MPIDNFTGDLDEPLRGCLVKSPCPHCYYYDTLCPRTDRCCERISGWHKFINAQQTRDILQLMRDIISFPGRGIKGWSCRAAGSDQHEILLNNIHAFYMPDVYAPKGVVRKLNKLWSQR